MPLLPKSITYYNQQLYFSLNKYHKSGLRNITKDKTLQRDDKSKGDNAWNGFLFLEVSTCYVVKFTEP